MAQRYQKVRQLVPVWAQSLVLEANHSSLSLGSFSVKDNYFQLRSINEAKSIWLAAPFSPALAPKERCCVNKKKYCHYNVLGKCLIKIRGLLGPLMATAVAGRPDSHLCVSRKVRKGSHVAAPRWDGLNNEGNTPFPGRRKIWVEQALHELIGAPTLMSDE